MFRDLLINITVRLIELAVVFILAYSAEFILLRHAIPYFSDLKLVANEILPREKRKKRD